MCRNEHKEKNNVMSLMENSKILLKFTFPKQQRILPNSVDRVLNF